MKNIANVLLILGITVIHFVYGLEPWITLMTVAVGLMSWEYNGFSNERKKIYESKIDLNEAKSYYYRCRGMEALGKK